MLMNEWSEGATVAGREAPSRILRIRKSVGIQRLCPSLPAPTLHPYQASCRAELQRMEVIMRAPQVGGFSHRAIANFTSWERTHSRSWLLSATTTRSPTPSSAALGETTSFSVSSPYRGFPCHSASSLEEEQDTLQGCQPRPAKLVSRPPEVARGSSSKKGSIAVSESLRGGRD